MQQLISRVTTQTLVLALSTFNSTGFSTQDDHILKDTPGICRPAEAFASVEAGC